ncbi:MAG TPA: hypothetical protein VEW03_06220, partial [Longimicrobiaceae bacterium]|nr:hypothetical protein [Longimicrobiaceae bacterium]
MRLSSLVPPLRVSLRCALSLLVAAALYPAPPAGAVPHTPAARPPRTTSAPTVTIIPASGSWNGSASSMQLSVRVEWCDATVFSPGGRYIALDGQDVTASFGYVNASKAGCTRYAYSDGTITLTGGTHTLMAQLEGSTGEIGAASAIYTYTVNTPPTYTVNVTPKGQAVTRAEGKLASERFTVTNTGSAAATYTLQAACTHAGAGCGVSLASVTLPAGGAVSAAVSYRAPVGAGQTATVRLKAWKSDAATVRDSGSYVVTTVAAPNPGLAGDASENTVQERSACLTLPAALDGAYECGDLRLAHALPSTRVLNRGFTPTLVYNSGHAHPYVVVGASLAPPPGATPTAIVATLRLANGTVVTRSFPGWAPGVTQRIAVGL